MCRSRLRGDETHKLNETCGKGKGKGNGGKGYHANRRGEFGGKGAARIMKRDDEGGVAQWRLPWRLVGGSYLQATLRRTLFSA